MPTKKPVKTKKTIKPAPMLRAHADPWVIGAQYLLRTVTNYWTGRLVAVHPLELVLADAAWIADTGRWAQAISTGALSEVEAMPADHQVIVARGALVDACQWSHPLPRETR